VIYVVVIGPVLHSRCSEWTYLIHGAIVADCKMIATIASGYTATFCRVWTRRWVSA